MGEEIENGVVSDGSSSLDPSEITNELGEIKEILEGLQPTPEEIAQQEQQAKELAEQQEQKETVLAEQYATELESLQAINDNLLTLESALVEQNELILEQTAKGYEGNFILVVAIVISVAVYMFWNQLTKW